MGNFIGLNTMNKKAYKQKLETKRKYVDTMGRFFEIMQLSLDKSLTCTLGLTNNLIDSGQPSANSIYVKQSQITF